jgi:hypothetical protein
MKIFPVLYPADIQMTALLEAEVLFAAADGLLHGAPPRPRSDLTLECDLIGGSGSHDDRHLWRSRHNPRRDEPENANGCLVLPSAGTDAERHAVRIEHPGIVELHALASVPGTPTPPLDR